MQVTEAQSAVDDPPDRSDASFSALVEMHSGAVFRLARSVVRDPALADDVTQDTFIAV